MITAVVDTQFGDNGKARLVDYLMFEYDAAVKTNGGPNSGGRVVIKDKVYKLHNIPASILRNKPSYIAQTCLINPEKLLKEIEYLENEGFDVKNNLKISPYAHTITRFHIEQDEAMENTPWGVGSTKQGISPCSRDKYSRRGVRLFECALADQFEKYFVDVSAEINKLHQNGKDILLQTSQGTMLDPDWGNYPYVSTTSNTASAAAMGAGIAPYLVQRVIGLMKPYTTIVSTQPFPLEIKDQKLNDTIVQRGGEMGTTTGRRRRIGWLSLPLLQYACRVNGVTELTITKGDVLEGLPVQWDERNLSWFTESDPLWMVNYKPFLTEYSKSFCYRDFVRYFNKTISLVLNDLPQIKYVSTGDERNQMEC